MTRTTITLDMENIEQLDEIARQEKLSRSWLIRKAIKDYVQNFNQKNEEHGATTN